MKRFLTMALLLISVASPSALAYDFKTDDGLCYNINDDGKSVTVTYETSSSGHYSNLSGEVVIPEYVTYESVTYPVTFVASDAFYGCSGLVSVTIGNCVTSISYRAFYGCSRLTNVTIGNSVTSIGYEAFSGCSGLTSVTIPNSVTSIGYDAFYGTAWYNNQPDGLVYAGPVAYKYKGTMPSGTSIVLKEGTTGITESAFSGCSGLTSVTIPNSVTEIGHHAFCDCSSLTSITIPNSVTEIDYGVFYDCSSLASISIPNSVTEIGEYAFYGCSGLTSVTIPNSVTAIGGKAFLGCIGLTEVSLPTSIESLGSYLFSSTLRELYVHWDDPITIGEGVFEYCYKNTILHVPKGAAKYYQARQGWKNFETIWEDAETDGVTAVRIDEDAEAIVDVLNVNGQLLRRGLKRSEALTGLQPGIYIVGGQKVVAQ